MDSIGIILVICLIACVICIIIATVAFVLAVTERVRMKRWAKKVMLVPKK